MKKLILFLLIAVSTVAKAQQNLVVLPQTNGKVVYNETIAMPVQDRAMLFDWAKNWMIHYYSNKTVPIENLDIQSYTLTGKGFFILKTKSNILPSKCRYDYQIKITCNNNNYQVTFYNITYSKKTTTDEHPETAVPIETLNNQQIKTPNSEYVASLNAQFDTIFKSLQATNASGTNVQNPNAAYIQYSGSPFPEVDGKIEYENIVDVPEKSQDFIFNAANKWMLDTFNGPAAGILSADKTQGQILGKAGFKIDEVFVFVPPHNYTYRFKIQIDCKDQKYRIRLYDITYANNISMEDYNSELKQSKSQTLHQNADKIDAQFKYIILSLSNAISKASTDDF